jgi:putative salt-induced outer membrane protein YdiY
MSGFGSRSNSLRVLVLALAAACAGQAADHVVLKNGDRLTGSVVKTDGTNLIFKSEYAGVVTIPLEAVNALDSSDAVWVGLKGGQVVSGPIELSAEKAEMRTAATGLVSTARGEIEYIRSGEEQRAWETVVERYRNPRIVDLWTGFVDLGLSGARGNARTSTIANAANATRLTSRDKIEVYFNSLYASNSTTGQTLVTANAMRGGLRYNLNVSPSLFGFAATDLEFDEFQSLDLRFAPSGGLGYHLWKGERGYVDLRGGVSMNREFFTGGVNRTSAEALFAQEALYRLSERSLLRQKLSLYPNLSDTGDYRANLDLSAETALWRWLGWHFTVSDRLLSNPIPGRKRNDFVFTTGLRLTFAK